jgi:phenylalanyl-tRNA synthetase beta chain
MVVRDLAFLVPQGVAVADLIEAVRRDAPQWLQAVWVFDCYQGSPLPEGTKSVALRLQWQHEERTLTDAEIDEAVAAAVARVSRQCGATLRQ